MHPLVRIITSEEFRKSVNEAASHHLFRKVETGFVISRSTKKGVLYTDTIIGNNESISFKDWREHLTRLNKEDWEDIKYSEYSDHRLIDIGNLHFHPIDESARYIIPSSADPDSIEVTEEDDYKVIEVRKGLKIISKKKDPRKEFRWVRDSSGDLAYLEREARASYFISMVAAPCDLNLSAIDILVIQRKVRQRGPNNDTAKTIYEINQNIGDVIANLSRKGVGFHEGNLAVAKFLDVTNYYRAQVFTLSNGEVNYKKEITRFMVN